MSDFSNWTVAYDSRVITSGWTAVAFSIYDWILTFADEASQTMVPPTVYPDTCQMNFVWLHGNWSTRFLYASAMNAGGSCMAAVWSAYDRLRIWNGYN
ncbi:uncharacterized protein PHACADRAFT_203118 [Phanerochaete carnosa HHB-10118-sp]|uniref:Uncharacterized protein n=1 Tax=Phanerochaete carnosa (strain HHB-10118-sp) TaxID=650164 RepID=K5WDE3_PHACS|nr:uncharacterized protein PHACADRAFT_203118 [Phanerochaete carnosa HHB-10118-sp]EKM48197.1 hypothetical protein PHACADRAFT_203118 [Phanerochaete carnosa HHB-10118-sp]